MKTLEQTIRDAVEIRNVSVTVEGSEESEIVSSLEDLKKGTPFVVRISPHEDPSLPAILTFKARDDLMIASPSPVLSKPNVGPLEDITIWLEKLDIPKLSTQIARAVTSALKA